MRRIASASKRDEGAERSQRGGKTGVEAFPAPFRPAAVPLEVPAVRFAPSVAPAEENDRRGDNDDREDPGASPEHRAATAQCDPHYEDRDEKGSCRAPRHERERNRLCMP